jgi:hypothetical protein
MRNASPGKKIDARGVTILFCLLLPLLFVRPVQAASSSLFAPLRALMYRGNFLDCASDCQRSESQIKIWIGSSNDRRQECNDFFALLANALANRQQFDEAAEICFEWERIVCKVGGNSSHDRIEPLLTEALIFERTGDKARAEASYKAATAVCRTLRASDQAALFSVLETYNDFLVACKRYEEHKALIERPEFSRPAPFAFGQLDATVSSPVSAGLAKPTRPVDWMRNSQLLDSWEQRLFAAIAENFFSLQQRENNKAQGQAFAFKDKFEAAGVLTVRRDGTIQRLKLHERYAGRELLNRLLVQAVSEVDRSVRSLPKDTVDDFAEVDFRANYSMVFNFHQQARIQPDGKCNIVPIRGRVCDRKWDKINGWTQNALEDIGNRYLKNGGREYTKPGKCLIDVQFGLLSDGALVGLRVNPRQHAPDSKLDQLCLDAVTAIDRSEASQQVRVADSWVYGVCFQYDSGHVVFSWGGTCTPEVAGYNPYFVGRTGQSKGRP